MDAFGHVNNTVYYRYFESARVLMDERISFHDAENNIGAILAEQSCRYRIPVIYPDTLTIGLRNIDERLRTLYGPTYGLIIQSEIGSGSTVIIKLPLEPEGHAYPDR